MQRSNSYQFGLDRLLVVASLWLTAGLLVYFVYLPASDDYSFLRALPLQVIPLSFQPLAGPFLTLAITVALLLACVWALRCSRDGAFLVCAAWALVAVARVVGNETGFWGRLDPILPGLVQIMGSFHQTISGVIGGGFNADDMAVAIVGSALAYMVVVNSVPQRA